MLSIWPDGPEDIDSSHSKRNLSTKFSLSSPCKRFRMYKKPSITHPYAGAASQGTGEV